MSNIFNYDNINVTIPATPSLSDSSLTRCDVLPVSLIVSSIYEPTNAPPHYQRSDKQYSCISLDEFKARGFDDPYVEALAKILPPGAIIAGGAVASAIANDGVAGDIDIFFTSAEAFEATYNMLLSPPNDPLNSWVVNSYTCDATLQQIRDDSSKIRHVKFVHPDKARKPIQLIKIVWFSGSDHVIDSFDFTVCQFAICNGNVWFNPMSPIDLLKKRLVINRLQYPVTSLRRLIKYSNKGYLVPAQMMLKIAEHIKASQEIDPNGEAAAWENGGSY